MMLAACQNDQVSIQNDITSNIDRPHDPWVFRSVLDNQARMITIALADDVWLAYNTQTGAIHKIWNGLVNFEGAVYNYAHGPQPTSVGDAYLINSPANPWSLKKDGTSIATTFHYNGHRFVNDDVELMFQLEDSNNGTKVKVNELVHIATGDGGKRRYIEWVIRTEDMPVGYQVSRQTAAASLVSVEQFVRPNDFSISAEEKYSFDGREFVSVTGVQTLGANAEKKIMQQIVTPTFPDENISDGFEDEVGALPPGAELIAKNDCRTCHNKTKKTVGPAYVSIAKKYQHNDANLKLLTSKIKVGGSGVWSQQKMTPHPEIPNADLETMVEYIFSLADFDGEIIEENVVSAVANPSGDVKLEDLTLGAVTRVYDISQGTAVLPTDWTALTPKMGGVLKNFDNLEGSDFVELDNNFALYAQGYFHMPEDGDIKFRMWSDDGSRLKINGHTIVDNDGLHGTEMKETRVSLKKGFHPFEVEFFQGLGGRFLSWNMCKGNEDAWMVVPPDRIFHHPSQTSVIANMTLPMASQVKIPGDGFELESVHPAFTLSQARPDSFEPKVGGMDFLPDGRLLVSTWDAHGALYVLDGVGKNNHNNITVKKIATGLAEPLGVKVVDGEIYVMQKQEITHLKDTDGDDIIDEYRALCDDWGVTSNFHEFGFGLEEKDGKLYANLATGILPGGAGMPNQHPDRGSHISVDIKTGQMERVANGLRTPNGVGIGYNGEMFVSDNQGDWLPSSKIMHVEKGDWFGSRAVDFEGTADFTEKKPVVWLPQDEIGNSPSVPTYINVGPYKNQMIHGEVTHGGVKRVFVEEVEGQYQGALFRFIQGLEAGINRLKWGPDGALYVGGIGNPGNWATTGLKWFGLQRLEYNNESAFEMLAVRAKSNGIEIEFTEPIAEYDGGFPSNYEIRQWYYKPTAEYGGPKLDERRLQVKSVNVLPGRNKVFLELEGMKEDHVVYVRLKGDMKSAKQQSLWSTEAWYTMNKIPKNNPGKLHSKSDFNSLSDAEKATGWRLLYDGKSLDNFQSYNSSSLSPKWETSPNAIHFNPAIQGQGGDIMTKAQYEDFELSLEWRIQDCGNSGIFFNVQKVKDQCCTWSTGPEMQVLDNTCHPDAKIIKHRAGDLYDLIESSTETVKPAGEWNQIKIISKDANVEFWQNGEKVVSFTMHDENWKNMIANSKFKDMPEFGKYKHGHIALQDHGDKVWYRNIKIREL